MKQYKSTGDAGRFLGLFSTLVNAAFSYGGVEMVAVAAGEAEDPRRNIPKAVRRVFWRILFFYVLGSLAIGVLLPYNEDRLLSNDPGAAASPWVIAVYRAGVPVLPSIINAVILTSATSSANAFLYTGSRYLYALAQNGQAPRFLLKCSKRCVSYCSHLLYLWHALICHRGVPYFCIGITASISLLTYLSCSSGSATVFKWFQNLTTIANLWTWISICIAYIHFYFALKAQGIDRNTLVFKSPFQPYTAIFALSFFTIIIIFNGFYVFKPWVLNDFITAYVGIPIYLFLFLFWKILKRTRWIPPSQADIQTGKAALDAADLNWPERKPRNTLERVWFWIAWRKVHVLSSLVFIVISIISPVAFYRSEPPRVFSLSSKHNNINYTMYITLPTMSNLLYPIYEVFNSPCPFQVCGFLLARVLPKDLSMMMIESWCMPADCGRWQRAAIDLSL